MPIAVNLFTGRKHLKAGSWDFGIIGLICNVIAVGKLAYPVPSRAIC
jgi:hypothetical protein